MGRRFVVFIGIYCSLSSCALHQTKYQRRYNEVWREMIKTQAWKESLIKPKNEATPQLYASAAGEVILDSGASTLEENSVFEDRYQSLVSRAYFKIITEAEKLDARISAEYKTLQDSADVDRTARRRRDEVEKKYKAHRAMLTGLKSWNIFSEDRSGDLDYFKKEHREIIKKMMEEQQGTDQMINFLIYKLADLYHVEEE